MAITKDPNTGLFPATIDGLSYEFEEWGAKEALGVIFDLAPIGGKPFGNLLSAVVEGRKGLGSDVSGERIAAAVGSLFTEIGANRDAALRIIQALGGRLVRCDGRLIDFDNHYKGRLSHLRKVVLAAAEVQLGDFFADGVTLLASLRPPAAAEEPTKT